MRAFQGGIFPNRLIRWTRTPCGRLRMLYPYFNCPTRRPPSRYVQGRLSKRMFQRGSSALMEQVDTMKEQVDTMKVVKRKLTMPLLLVNLAVSLVSGGV